MYLVCLESMGCPPANYRKLCSALDQALSLVSNSTGWDYYEIYECEILKEIGRLDPAKLSGEYEHLRYRMNGQNEPQMPFGIYCEYMTGEIPWRQTMAMSFQEESELNDWWEHKLAQRCDFVACIKVTKHLCCWTKDDMII